MKLDLRRRRNGRPNRYRPGTAHTPPSCIEPSPLIERNGVEPPVFRAVTGGPHDRVESAQLELGRYLPDHGRFGAVRLGDVGVDQVLSCEFVDPVEQPVLLEVGVGDEVGQATRELGHVARDSHQLARHADTLADERVDVEGTTFGASHELERRQSTSPREVLDLLVSFVELTDRVHPPVDVVAAVRARQSDVVADREGHVSPAALQLVGDLGPRGRSADDEHVAARELRRIAVLEGGELIDPERNVGGHGRQPRFARRPRSGDDRIARPGALVGDHVEASTTRPHVLDGDVRTDRRPETLPVGTEQRDRLVLGHEAIRVRAVVTMAGQSGHPVRGQQPERVPPLGAPRVGHLPPVEDDVVDPPPGEVVAHRQSGLAGADHHDWRSHHVLRPPRPGWSWGWRRCRTPPSASATGRRSLRGRPSRRRHRWRR